MQKQLKPTLIRKKDLLIKNLKYYSYCIVNLKGLSKLNIINAIVYF